MDQRAVPLASRDALMRLSDDARSRTLVIVQDAFTSYFESQLVLDVIELLDRLGFNVMVAPFAANGKPLHVHGFMKRFAKVAQENTEMLREFEALGVALVGIDPSMTLTYRQEYAQVVEGDLPAVQLLQEWLSQQTEVLVAHQLHTDTQFKLMAHCTEKTNAAPSIAQWRSIFRTLGLNLDLVAIGCCGMSGTFGHETGNFEHSRTIYEQSWGPLVRESDEAEELLATGYSCRSQVKRFDNQQLRHPAQALLSLLN